MDIMLTTDDNPFNPFTQWDDWFGYDTLKGYGTPSYLARLVRTSDELSEADQSVAIDDAIREIVANDPTGIYRAVTEKDFDAQRNSGKEKISS